LTIPVFVSAETKAGLTPASPFYFFDAAFENVSLFFTFNPEKKAQKALKYADERLEEAKESASDNKLKAVEKAMEGYEKVISLATEKSKELKDDKKSEEILKTVSESTAKHQEVLVAVLDKVSDEAKEAILRAIETSKKGQEEALKQILRLEDENSKLKKRVEELKSSLMDKENKRGYEGEEDDKNTVEKNEDVEKLRKEVEVLKKSQQAQRIAEDEARKKQEAETLLAEQRKIEEKVREIEKMKAEKLAEEQRSVELARQWLQDCLNNNYTKEQLRVATESAISTLNNSAEKSMQRIRDTYDREIALEKEQFKQQRESATARTGGAFNTAALKQLDERTENSLKDLEFRRDELLAMAEEGLAQQISNTRIKQLEMEKETSEAKCY